MSGATNQHLGQVMRVLKQERGLLVDSELFLNGLLPGCMKLEPQALPVDAEAPFVLPSTLNTRTPTSTHNHTCMRLHARTQATTLSLISEKDLTHTLTLSALADQ